MTFSPIPEIIEDFKAGKMIVLVDDPDRENEGDICVAAEKATPEKINFMAKYGRGLICLAMDQDMVDRLQLPMMTSNNQSRLETPFTVSIEAREGVTTGISAYDRAHTILTAVSDDCKPSDLVVPGHIFPLRARKGGVLVRTGQTEGSVDIARLAGLKPAGVICEIMNDDGTMSRVPELKKFCEKHELKMCTIADLIKYRRKEEKLIERVQEVKMPTAHGDFDFILYRSIVDQYLHIALTMGGVGKLQDDGNVLDTTDPVLVRVHSECLTGDLFHSLRCDCGEQLHHAMEKIKQAGKGVLLYMRQEGRGIGLENKIQAYKLQEGGLDTVQANEELGFGADLRDYGIGAQILADLGVHKLRLMTNNPKKIVGLESYGLEIVEKLPIEITPNANNEKYLKTKKTKLGHLLDLD